MKKTLRIILSIILLATFVTTSLGFISIGVKSIKINVSNITLQVGKTYSLKVTFTPNNTTNKILTFSSGNKNVATVDKNGIIKGIKDGNTVITITSSSNKKAVAKCNVLVTSQIYPVKTNKKLTYWGRTNPSLNQVVKNRGETLFAKELEKKTGIKIQYIHPPMGQELNAFSILVASGDLPDMIENNWIAGYPGGVKRALDDGVIIKLNNVIDNYSPNLKKYISENPEVNKSIKIDDGSIPLYPAIRGDSICMIFVGPMLRNDWINELGLQVPTTIDEWETVLTAFKDKKNVKAPLTGTFAGSLTYFAGAYNAFNGFYVENSKVKYGQIEPGYKDFLNTLRNWYRKGLLDKNFSTVDFNVWSANMLSGQSGATIGYLGGHLGTWLNAMKSKDPNFDLISTTYPTLKKGEKPKFGQLDASYTGANSVAITQSCNKVELAARFLDYGYSKEGNMLFNFGIEGESYTIVEGYPKFTDLILNNPQKLAFGAISEMYCRASASHGPFVMDKKFTEQANSLKQQKDALKNWSNTDMAKYRLPLISFTASESSEIANIITGVNTLEQEVFYKIIMGIEPIESYDKYVQQVKKMGIEKIISIYQNAFERFSKR